MNRVEFAATQTSDLKTNRVRADIYRGEDRHGRGDATPTILMESGIFLEKDGVVRRSCEIKTVVRGEEMQRYCVFGLRARGHCGLVPLLTLL
jgi:hypothetical protein